MMTQISLDKHYKTRDGREVVLVALAPALEGECSYPVIGYIKSTDGRINPSSWTRAGEWLITGEGYDANLVEVPKKYTQWLNIYPGERIFPYPSKQEADKGSGSERIACIEVIYTEGEGL